MVQLNLYPLRLSRSISVNFLYTLIIGFSLNLVLYRGNFLKDVKLLALRSMWGIDWCVIITLESNRSIGCQELCLDLFRREIQLILLVKRVEFLLQIHRNEWF